MDENYDLSVEDFPPPDPVPENEQSVSNTELVKKLQKRIKADKQQHMLAFRNMRRDMFLARNGRMPDYPKESYTANIIGRHIKQKTASLYAKNPRAVARRRETMDFVLWDENPDTLAMAFQVSQQAAMMASAAPPAIDPMTGAQIPPQLPPEVMQAQSLLADFQQGMSRREKIAKIGKTLEILYAYAMREQAPVDFKVAMKQVVRRACTTGVGYVEIGFQRETAQAPEIAAKLTDARARLDHLRRLATEVADGTIEKDDAEMAELERSIADLMATPEIVTREGLVYDYPPATKVIPDRMCRNLVGFQGASHLTIEYLFTPDQVRELFPDAKLEKDWNSYQPSSMRVNGDSDEPSFMNIENSAEFILEKRNTNEGLVCVWKHYDKLSGLVYYLADGHGRFLKEPAPPDVYVEGFWPVFALTFNAVENEDEVFPPSDVTLLMAMQEEYNRARQGLREHRSAARPRFAYARGGLDDEDAAKLSTAKPFDVVPINMAPNEKIADKLQAIQIPGVDPNLYETAHLFSDMQLVGGAQEANYGAVAKATATESAIAANSTASSDGASVDDLDAFLTAVARASGQILLREMSAEQVREIAGPGAVWPQDMDLDDISEELFLEVEAGSSGKPNQAVEVNNWQQMLPYLIQLPGVNPMWLARETIRRLDDRADLTEAIAAGMPSVMMQNRLTQVSTGNPATDPNAQDLEGESNEEQGEAGPAGTGPAFGSNQV